MKIRYQAPALVLLLPLLGVGCNDVRAKSAFKDGNKAYREENFKKAVEHYQKAVDLEPGMAEAHFYLGSAHQAMYRPGKETPENKAQLDSGIAEFKKSLEVNDGSTENLKKVRANTLAALTGIYAEDPYKNFDEALSYAKQLVQENPNDPKNLFAMANLYEKFEKIDQAEETYKRVVEVNPQDAKACAALAGFYNKALWDGKSKFDLAIGTLEKCATIDPNDPSGWYKVAVFYWDKAYRDPFLNDEAKDSFADKGLEAVDKALAIKPDYVDGLVYKGLLLRVKAQVTNNARLRVQYLDQAQTLAKQAKQLRTEQASSGKPAAAASPAAQ
jgi:tetratricopeptide (TPR) repeat protein